MHRLPSLVIPAALAVASLAGCHPARPSQQATTGQTPAEVSPSEAALGGTSRPPTVQERAIIHSLMDDAAAVRALPFLHDVDAEIQDEARIRAFVEADIDQAELREARELYTSLGLLPANVDLEALLLEVLGEQIVGYYDPEGQRLVVRDDVMRSLARSSVDEARVVLVHELVHALQDQHLQLGVLNEVERDSDADNAYRSLVEGDATLAMVAYVLAAQGTPLEGITSDPDVLERFFESGAATSGADALDRAPAILRVTLMAPYTRGALFCGDRHRTGGWSTVDQAHRVLPVSSEQILHPDKYSAGELPDPIALSPAPVLESLGYVRVQEDTLGELELSIYLAQGTSTDQDAPAAAGWSGDRLAVYARADAPSAVVWWTSWDSEREAEEAERAALRAGASVDGSLVVRSGRALMILRHVPTAATAELTARFTAFARALPAAPPHR